MTGQSTGSAARILLVAARTDLLSDCVAEVLGSCFPTMEIVVHETGKEAKALALAGAGLVIFYKADFDTIREFSIALRRSKKPIAIAIFWTSGDDRHPDLGALTEQRLIDGVFPVSIRLDVFLTAVDLLLKGGEYFPSSLLASQDETASGPDGRAWSDEPRSASPKDFAADLTSREMEILDLLSVGNQNKIIAAKLDLSENTVKVHIRNIYKKMRVRNRTEAVSRLLGGDARRATSNPVQYGV